MEALTDIDRLIERRFEATPDPDTLEASYMESVRNHARLAEEHAARAEALLEPGRG